MMHGLGMGTVGIFSLLIPLLLIGGAGVLVAVLLRNRRRGIEDLDQREIESNRGMVGEGAAGQRSFAQTIFHLARQHGGVLTISDVVMETGLAPGEAESRMNELVDGTRVTMEVTESGGVRYEFPELREE